MTRFTRSILLVLCIALSGCASRDYSFVRYGQKPEASTGNFNADQDPQLSDIHALNFASSVASILRSKYTGARITREVSSTAQIGLAAFGGAGASAFSLGTSTIAALGLGSAGIPELQRIFGAKDRAQVYQDAVRLIEEAQIEYLALNQRPTTTLTQNGVTLYQRVTASLHVVEKTLAGNLPSVEDMQKATERMSETGATRTAAGNTPSNLIPANGKAPVRKLEPVVIERTIVKEVGLQADQVLAITRAAGAVLKKATVEQGQAVAAKIGIVVEKDQDPREALSQVLGGSSITATKAADILKELQKQVP